MTHSTFGDGDAELAATYQRMAHLYEEQGRFHEVSLVCRVQLYD